MGWSTSAQRLVSKPVGCNSCDPGESGTMYIGLGTLVLVLVVVGIVYFVRRA
jgi:hypothetical protein